MVIEIIFKKSVIVQALLLNKDEILLASVAGKLIILRLNTNDDVQS